MVTSDSILDTMKTEVTWYIKEQRGEWREREKSITTLGFAS